MKIIQKKLYETEKLIFFSAKAGRNQLKENFKIDYILIFVKLKFQISSLEKLEIKGKNITEYAIFINNYI